MTLLQWYLDFPLIFFFTTANDAVLDDIYMSTGTIMYHVRRKVFLVELCFATNANKTTTKDFYPDRIHLNLGIKYINFVWGYDAGNC